MAKQRKSMLQVRGGFSDTSGIAPCNTVIQYAEFDDRTRIQLSNYTFELLDTAFSPEHSFRIFKRDVSSPFCKDILGEVFSDTPRLANGYLYNWKKVFESKFDPVFVNAPYNEVLDLIYYICNWLVTHATTDEMQIAYSVFNDLFEREYVGYRFVNGQIVAITNQQEIFEIEQACSNPYDGVCAHIKKATGFLGDREHKDYKNCIKESICAVESICQIVIGDPHATLGQALKRLEDYGIIIHPSLKSAFAKLYGYTSDEGGIRHSEGLFESDVNFEEARFMLVSCSAFVNYLISKNKESI